MAGERAQRSVKEISNTDITNVRLYRPYIYVCLPVTEKTLQNLSDAESFRCSGNCVYCHSMQLEYTDVLLRKHACPLLC